MQDYAMKKNSASSMTSKSINNAAFGELVRGDTSRIAMIVSPPATGHILINTEATDPITNGIRLFAGAEPLTITLDEHGEIVQKTFFAVHSAGTEVITVMETTLYIPQTIWQSIWRAIMGG